MGRQKTSQYNNGLAKTRHYGLSGHWTESKRHVRALNYIILIR